MFKNYKLLQEAVYYVMEREVVQLFLYMFFIQQHIFH